MWPVIASPDNPAPEYGTALSHGSARVEESDLRGDRRQSGDRDRQIRCRGFDRQFRDAGGSFPFHGGHGERTAVIGWSEAKLVASGRVASLWAWQSALFLPCW